MHGLSDPTAVLTLQIEGRIDGDAVQRLVSRARANFAHADGIPAEGLPEALLSGPHLRGGVEMAAASMLAALCVAFQRAARDAVGLARVVSASKGAWVLALPYHRREVLHSGLPLMLDHFRLWIKQAIAPAAQKKLAEATSQWLRGVQGGSLAPNTLRFALAARELGHPVSTIGYGVIQLGWGSRQQRMESSFTGQTSVLATRIAKNKPLANALLARAGLPVPRSALVSNWDQALKVAQELGWPVVVKPANLDQGQGVVPDIHDEDLLRRSFERAAALSSGRVLVEKHVEGADHRLLVVGGRLLVATRRLPGGVTGDGHHTVAQLLAKLNADPRRGTDQRSLLKTIELDEEAATRLAEQGLNADSVVELGRFVTMRRTANISTGGTALDVTDQVHPDNRWLAERAARVVGLDIAGIDLLCPDIARSWRKVGGAICEVNAQPGFRPHWLGDPARDVNAEIVEWLCRGGTRVPTAAITGTNGKSTTARMLHHIWLATGRCAGLSSSSGVWVGSDRMLEKAPVGVTGARMLLDDPGVEAVVLELPRLGLITLGHPCDHYDVAALLNVQDDHIGVNGIDSMEAMARFKAQVLERASQAVVINADDALCLSVRGQAGATRQVLVSRVGDANPAVGAHLAEGKDAVLVAWHAGAEWIVMAQGETRTPLMPLNEIPATMNGLLRFNEANALSAAALAWAQGIPLDTVRAALGTFANTLEHNPGRYNVIGGFPFTVLLDFGHNPDGIREICNVARRWSVAGRRRLVTSHIGNRHRSHVALLAPDVAAVFDDAVISQDAWFVRHKSDWTGEHPEVQHLAQLEQSLCEAGMDGANVTIIADVLEAVRQGLQTAEAGDLLVLLVGEGALPVIRQALREREAAVAVSCV
ncbi:Mur ligase family protein [Hydrogenophaga sp. BPS33]|uniref:Mur ligase family protein n=1 Tax=Hydrogenophaga sp. BPS33 TaxID=2651974 RepID=UPI00131F8E66|nr:Mur ligase family protein [Hydrogenophaga sp. BPS33]QHE87168.1 cyanophycin synthetase [Hydrogenophaga sp. BPS33]